MKTKLNHSCVLLICVASVISVNAQWTNGIGTNIYKTTTGNVGVNTTAPGFALDVVSTTYDNGIRVSSSLSTSNVGLHLNNLTSGGHRWSVMSMGLGDPWGGAGNLAIYDHASTSGSLPRIFISGGAGSNAPAGNIGIGTTSPNEAKLNVVDTYNTNIYSGPNYYRNSGRFEMTSSVWGTFTGATGVCRSTIPSGGNVCNGLMGESYGNNVQTNGISAGVYGYATGNYVNYGGSFRVDPTSNSIWNAAVFGETMGASGAWAGYFNGPVYSSVGFTPSDQNFKNNIKPLTNALDKIRLLNPTTYEFKTSEYKTMSFPEGTQMGLIAQELEKVFPELVKEIPLRNHTNEKGEITSTLPSFKSVNYTSLIPLLISAVKEQDEIIQNQQIQIDRLKELVNSVVENNISNIGVEKSTKIISEINNKNSIVLNQNVPNPFAENTVITYNIPEDFTKAEIVFTTNDGAIIKTVQITEKGKGSVNVFANDLSHGMYTYTLVIDGKSIDSKKMIKE